MDTLFQYCSPVNAFLLGLVYSTEHNHPPRDTYIFKSPPCLCVQHIVPHFFPPALTRMPLAMCSEHKVGGKMVQILKTKPKCFLSGISLLNQVLITRSWMFTFGEWSLGLASGSWEEMSLDSL